jgi:hypothetical protein
LIAAGLGIYGLSDVSADTAKFFALIFAVLFGVKLLVGARIFGGAAIRAWQNILGHQRWARRPVELARIPLAVSLIPVRTSRASRADYWMTFSPDK